MNLRASAKSFIPGLARASSVGLACFILLAADCILPEASCQTVLVDTTRPVNSFRPTEALGAGVDRIPRVATDKVFTEAILKQILSAGWQTVTYRQNTELYVEAWHWNPKGTWSAPGNKGYFVGDANPTEFIRHSYGYPLPHAGFSQPDGHSYSRLTDGSLDTYWKSNPYLTSAYTGEPDALHPQWVVVDLATPQQIDAIRIAWADPYAKKYLVQYWTGLDPIEKAAEGVLGHVSRRQRGQRKGRQRHAAAFPRPVAGAMGARLDDGIFQHLRYPRVRRSPQLPRVRHQRALPGHDLSGRLLSRRHSPHHRSRADQYVLFFG